MTQRVTDEKAIAIARQHPETLPSLFAWRTDDVEDLSKHHFTAQDLAADLLAARVALSRPLAGPVVADYEAGARAYVEASIDQDGPIFYATDEGAINLLTRAIIDAAIGEGKP